MPGPNTGLASPNGTPSGAQVAGGVGLAVGSNLATAFAPTVTQAMTGQSSMVGGPEVVAIAAALNLIAQHVKHYAWLDQDRWMHLILLVLGLAIAAFVFRDPIKALLNGANAAWQSSLTFHGLSSAGMAPAAAAPYSGANPAIPRS